MSGGLALGGLCSSASGFDAGLTTVEIIVKPTEGQKSALNELKTVSKLNSEAMTALCRADNPRSLPARLTASEQRLEAALAGIRKLKPAAEKFYASLNDEQKAQVNDLLMLPGL